MKPFHIRLLISFVGLSIVSVGQGGYIEPIHFEPSKKQISFQPWLLEGLTYVKIATPTVQKGDAVIEGVDIPSVDEIKKIVELKFRANKIEIEEDVPEWARDAQASVLVEPAIEVMKAPDGTYATHVSVMVSDVVKLQRKSNEKKVVVPIWESSIMGIGGSSRIKAGIKDAFDSELNDLCLEFLKANKK